MKITNFIFAPGSGFPADQATTVGKYFIELQERIGAEELTPKQVRDAARPVTSPIHQYFTWDDKTAGEERRLDQARHLLRSVQIEYIDLGRDRLAGRMRFLVNIRKEPEDETAPAPGERVYVPMVSALSDDSRRRQILIDALDQAIRWRNRHQHFKELADIFSAIERVEKQFLKEEES